MPGLLQHVSAGRTAAPVGRAARASRPHIIRPRQRPLAPVAPRQRRIGRGRPPGCVRAHWGAAGPRCRPATAAERIALALARSTTVFSHSQTVVLCGSCSTVLCTPTGGRARLTEGELPGSCCRHPGMQRCAAYGASQAAGARQLAVGEAAVGDQRSPIPAAIVRAAPRPAAPPWLARPCPAAP